MKKVLVSFLLMVGVTANSFAVETLFDFEEITDHAIYVAPVFKKGRSYSLSGARALWVFNHKYAVGYGSYTSTNFKVDNSKFRNNRNNADFSYKFQYSGIELEYIYDHESLIHYNFQSLIGTGKLDRRAQNIGTYRYVTANNKFEKTNFTIFEIGGGAEINLHKYFRVFTGLNYLHVGGVKFTYPDSFEDPPALPKLSGLAFILVLKFGKF